MAHVFRVTAARPVEDEASRHFQLPAAASSDPKRDLIDGLRAAFQNFRLQKQLGM